jgi:hypothetical protein
MLNFFRKNTLQDLQEQARVNFEKAQGNSGDSPESSAMRLRMSALCKAHIDKTFIDGAELTGKWQEACEHSLAQLKDKPSPPVPKKFQLVKMAHSENKLWTWIPEEYTQVVFNLGAKYQTMSISAQQAIEQTQLIADKICKNHLGLNSAFDALEFLRDQEGEQQP